MGIISPKLSAKEMAFLCRELATTYNAGIPLLTAFDMVSKHCGSMKMRQMLTRISNAIHNGADLDSAVRNEQKLLPEMFIEVVHAGEIGGRLDELFADLAEYYESLWQMWRSTTAAMVYPLLQLLSAWFLGTFSLGIVGKVNPFATEHFDLGNYLAAYFIFQLKVAIIVAVIIALLIFLGRLGVLRMPWALFKNVVWPIRYIANKFAMARFFRTLALLVASGLNMRQCIERSAAVTMNPLIERDLLKAIPVIMNGGSLVQAFSECKYINRVGHEMILVGEKSGQIDATLKKVAEYHYNEAESAVQTASKLLFVAIVLAIGVIIGGIVIYFYANMYGSMMKNF